jgi:hypothetical protein
MGQSQSEQSVRDWSYWDTVTIATTNPNASWFTTTSGKTKQQTNLSQQATFPTGNRLKVKGIRLVVHPLNGATRLTDRDVWEVLQGYYTMKTGGDHLEWEGHGYDIPAASGLHSQLDASAAPTSLNQNGFPAVSNRREFRMDIDVKGGDSFKIEAEFSPVIVLATSAIVTAYLFGIRAQPTKG